MTETPNATTLSESGAHDGAQHRYGNLRAEQWRIIPASFTALIARDLRVLMHTPSTFFSEPCSTRSCSSLSSPNPLPPHRRRSLRTDCRSEPGHRRAPRTRRFGHLLPRAHRCGIAAVHGVRRHPRDRRPRHGPSPPRPRRHRPARL